MNRIVSQLGRRIALAAVVVATAGCTHGLPDDAVLTEIPYRLQAGGRVVIDVFLNGEGPFRFSLDTASSGSFVLAETSRSLGLEPIPGAEVVVRGAVASGRFPVVAIDSLRVGSESRRDVALTILPTETLATRGLDGVLGADFMRRYAIAFLTRENRIRLYSPEAVANRSYGGFAPVRLAPALIGASAEPLYFLDVGIAGNTVPALFDLGAGLNLMNPVTAEALGLSTTRTEEAGEFAGAVGTREILARFDTQAIVTGNVRWRSELFVISDLEIFTTLGYADRPLAILGSGLFMQRDFVIDFPRNRILIRAAMPETEPVVVAESG